MLSEPHLQGEFGDKLEFYCDSGWITHETDEGLLDKHNYLTDSIYSYNTTCQHDGVWTKVRPCVSKSNKLNCFSF